MKNVLIIGANGFTGRQILKDLSDKQQHNVTGCSLHSDILSDTKGNYRFIETDIRDGISVKHLFEEVQPDVVVNCSALSVPDYCETHHEEAYLINVTAVEQLARLCEEHKSRFIHLSTDFVFDGKINESAGQLYTEEVLPAPVNYYGFTKWKGEERVAELCSNYAIVRVAIVYGKAMPGQHGNIVQLVMNRLQAGQEIRVVADQWRTPTYVGEVSDGVQLLMESTENIVENTANGIFHICGDECLTIAEMAYQVADSMNLDRTLIHPVTTEEMKEATPRPRFSGMSIDKAQKLLGYHPRKLKDILADWDAL
ncbi:SDR family oxidoreductase [uncultured Bacteroides sp.]|uniref:SDR family oxidoreductase n=1 Tax=uncultured Bacteroides sp. TaxID=162156 RepID=UPI0025FFD9C9|nr:SDR family oxidoreductase [uncultured Bacteroides sp.]